MLYLLFVFPPAGYRAISCVVELVLPFFVELAQDPPPVLISLFLPSVSILRDYSSFCRSSFFWARIRSDSRYLALTCSFSAIICPFSSPGLRMSSLSLTHTILLKTSLSLSGSRFVFIFELQDSSLKGFYDTAIISSSSPPFTSLYSRLYVPDE